MQKSPHKAGISLEKFQIQARSSSHSLRAALRQITGAAEEA